MRRSNALSDLINPGIEALSRRLSSQQVEPSLQDGVVDAVEGLNFPGLMSVLAISDAPNWGALSHFNDSIGSLGGQPSLPIDPTKLKSMIQSILVDRRHPNAAMGAAGVASENREEALARILQGLAQSNGFPNITPDQAAEAARLVLTGEFFEDTQDATAAIAHVVSGLPIALARDIPTSPTRLLSLSISMLRDVVSMRGSASQVLADLRDNGKLDRQYPTALTRTFRGLYRFATIASVAEMLRSLVAPENQSVRMAIVLYARANGIPLGEEDLDTLSNQVFNSENPDLSPLLPAAWDRLRTRYSSEEILDRLTQMGAD